MNVFLYVLICLAVDALAFWALTTNPDNRVFFFVVVLVFGIGPIGAFWMMYMSARYEKNPLPMILLAFVPYSFVWYYFERVRIGKLSRRAE